jgi:4'-phosphopantetheinyl transferase
VRLGLTIQRFSHRWIGTDGVCAEPRHEAFFRCWTRKEAYIKAKGEGLSLPLHQFDVSIEPAAKHALLATRPDQAEAAQWMLSDIAITPGYAAALAVAL